jgi:glycosyltransferase involved in cell wall biosynthesis
MEEKMKTTLSLIGKNEAKGLKDLIGDIGKYFDEIVLISTDHNKKLIKMAKKLGIKVYDEYFGKTGTTFDTAKARNFSFDRVRNFAFQKTTGDIVAWFDLDDRIPNGYVIPYIFKAMKNGRTDWVYCNYNYAFDNYGNVMNVQLKPRFMRKGTGHWEKAVHEDYVPDKNVVQVKDSDFLVEPLIVNHQNIASIEGAKKKAKRNLGILTAELKRDGKKTDLRTIQYIGTTLLTLEKYKEAIVFLMKHYNGSGSNEDRYWSLKRAAFCHRMLGNYNQAINLLLEALKLYPEWQTAYFDIAEIYFLQEDWKRVIEWTNIGAQKKYPDTVQMTQPLDHTLCPISRLADAYLMTGKFDLALSIAKKLLKSFPLDRSVKDLHNTCKNVVRTERFVTSFVDVASMIRQEDRLKAIKLFDIIPTKLEDDIRIQNLRFAIVPPRNWDDKSIVIYCGKGIGENWAYPSIFKGIGGSETAVIWVSKWLAKMGWKVTVYNNCGDMRGEYDGVEYIPFYHFNPTDNFNTLIAWRNPSFFQNQFRAKKKIVWLHDIAYPAQFSDKAIKNTDKFIFLSKWHRDNMPSIPDEKIFLSNNGIDPELFDGKNEKRPNSLLWTASYDRGLLPFIKNIWPLIKKEIPDVTLDVAYGWQNIDREKEKIPILQKLRDELTPLLKQEGIIHHDRLPQQELAELYKTSMVYAYASEFGETNNISSQQAQAGGCYVITTPQAGATPERLIFGELIDGGGIYNDKTQQQKYAKAVIKYLKHPKNAPKGIVERFGWEETAKRWKDGLL